MKPIPMSLALILVCTPATAAMVNAEQGVMACKDRALSDKMTMMYYQDQTAYLTEMRHSCACCSLPEPGSHLRVHFG
jgi:hypothetical protein